MNHPFEAYVNDHLIFYSDRRWLHPIFEFEKFLAGRELPVAEILVRDKIIGRAAALLLVRLGVRTIEAQTMSELGREVLKTYRVSFRYQHLVERIGCQTEVILKGELNPQTAYEIIRNRIQSRSAGS